MQTSIIGAEESRSLSGTPSSRAEIVLSPSDSAHIVLTGLESCSPAWDSPCGPDPAGVRPTLTWSALLF